MRHFSEILIVLGIAGLTIPFLHRFRISPVLGYLLCGLVIGPYGLALVAQESGQIDTVVIKDSQTIRSFAELGVIFLMFMIGLKLSLNELWGMRHHVLGLGSTQILLTGFIIFLIARGFGNTLEVSILLGACFSLSSTAIVMQLLEEKSQTDSPVGKLGFSILLMQDLAVVPILSLLTAFAGKTDESLAYLSGKAIVIAAASIFIIYFFGMKIIRPLLRYLQAGKKPEWLMSFVLFLVIGTAMLTEMAGLSAALGAFLAGLLLAETEYKNDVQDMIAPIKGVLLGMFFLSVGMTLDVREILRNPFWLFAAVIGIGALKAAILFLLCHVFGVRKKTAIETSILLGQGGEFVFVIMTMALMYHIISPADAQFFMLVTAMSMLVTPFVALLAPGIAEKASLLWRDRT